MGESMFGLLLARPGIAEIQIDAVDFAGSEKIRQSIGVSVDKTDVLESGSLRLSLIHI